MILDEKFWLTICFFMFIALVYRPTKKAILGIIDRKIAVIKADLNNAETGRIEAQNLLKHSQEHFNNIISERENLFKVASQDIDKLRIESEKELEILLKRKESDAHNRLDQIKESATEELSATFITTAKKLTELYLSENKDALPDDKALMSNLLSPKINK